jgi:hypothetical protein
MPILMVVLWEVELELVPPLAPILADRDGRQGLSEQLWNSPKREPISS